MKKNLKAQKIMTGLIMGAQCFNGMFSFSLDEGAYLRSNENGLPVARKEAHAPADSFTAACFQAIDCVDKLVFSTAEAALTISSGQVVSGGRYYSNATYNGETVEEGGTSIAGSFNKGAAQTVRGSAVKGSFGLESVQRIESGGSAISCEFSGGYYYGFGTPYYGVQYVEANAVATDTTLGRMGRQIVSSGGYASGTITVSAGWGAQGEQRVLLGGSVDDTTLGSNGNQLVYGVASTTVVNGGTQTIYSGGTALNNTINSAGKQYIRAGGVEKNTQINSLGQQHVMSGGSTSNTVVIGGTQVISSGGSASNMIISAGGQQIVQGGGSTNIVTLTGGTQYVENNGEAQEIIINAGGRQIIESNGRTNKVTINNGGQQRIENGGRGTDITINQGGSSHLEFGAEAEGLKIKGGTISFDAGASLGSKVNLTTGTIRLGEPHEIAAYLIENLEVQNKGLLLVGQTDLKGNTTPVGRVMNIDSLTGSLDFVINSDLANNKADCIVVNSNKNSKDNTLRVNFDDSADFGENIMGSALVVKASQDLKLKGVQSEIGAYSYMPILKQESEGWYLKGLNIIGVSHTGNVLGTLGGLTLAQWRDGGEILNRRLNNVRQNAKGLGLWAEINTSKIELNKVLEQQTTYVVGFDERNNEEWIYGGAFLYGKGTDSYSLGKGENQNYAFGLYTAWQGEKGHFADLILRGGRLKHELNFQRKSGGSLKDEYAQRAIAFTAKYGYNHIVNEGLYVEPFFKVGYAKTFEGAYTTQDYINVRNNGGQSVLGQIGLTLGTNYQDREFFSLDLTGNHEFSGDVNTALGSNGLEPLVFHQDSGRNWANIGLTYQNKPDKNVSWSAHVGRMGIGMESGGYWNYSFNMTYNF